MLTRTYVTFSVLISECDFLCSDFRVWLSLFWFQSVTFSVLISECDFLCSDFRVWLSLFWFQSVTFSVLISECDFLCSDFRVWLSLFWFQSRQGERDATDGHFLSYYDWPESADLTAVVVHSLSSPVRAVPVPGSHSAPWQSDGRAHCSLLYWTGTPSKFTPGNLVFTGFELFSWKVMNKWHVCVALSSSLLKCSLKQVRLLAF